MPAAAMPRSWASPALVLPLATELPLPRVLPPALEPPVAEPAPAAPLDVEPAPVLPGIELVLPDVLRPGIVLVLLEVLPPGVVVALDEDRAPGDALPALACASRLHKSKSACVAVFALPVWARAPPENASMLAPVTIAAATVIALAMMPPP